MPKPKQPKWGNSAIQLFLHDRLKDGRIPIDGMLPKEVNDTYCHHQAEFEPINNKDEEACFGSWLGYLRTKIHMKNDHSAVLEHNCQLFPCPTQDGFVLSFWPVSAAKELLAKDINERKHETMTKQNLWESREECYENFPYKVVIKHIHQEIHGCKFLTYWEEQRSKKCKVAD